MRTGSVGNRTAEDMVNTLTEPKKNIISLLRNKLLAKGYSEEVEYDAINVEPVLIYSRSENDVIFVRHKWSLVALIPAESEDERKRMRSLDETNFAKFETTDEDGKRWLKFNLPQNENDALEFLERSRS